ncbi:MAG: hypothetical protein NTW86_08185 [Candidatus Sumerlaeota bacterium]|nr:hypothetical protein [Candidatus Sumerlaeota bacterium]
MSKSRWVSPAVTAIVASFCCTMAQAGAPDAGQATFHAAKGRIATDADGAAIAETAATLEVGPAPSGPYRLDAQIQLAEQGASGDCRFALGDPNDPKAPLAQVAVNRDKGGRTINVALQRLDDTGKWANVGPPAPFVYWPKEDKPAKPAAQKSKSKAKSSSQPTGEATEASSRPAEGKAKAPRLTPEQKLEAAGIPERSWRGRWIGLRLDVNSDSAQVWFDGRFVGAIPAPSACQCPLSLQLGAGDKVRNASISPLRNERMVCVDLRPQANDRFPAEFQDARIEVDGVPFLLPQGPDNQLSLRQAQWIEWDQDSSAYVENYDGGAPIFADPRMTMLRIPAADYVAAHVLAVAEDDPGQTSRLTLRAGSYEYSKGSVVQYDFTAAVPRRADLARAGGVRIAPASAGPLAHVRAAMPRAFAQDLRGLMDVELTKEVRLAVRSPDPCRYRYRPLGLPSGVRIAAVTFEKSPLQMKVASPESGNVFVQPEKPKFDVNLQNITDREQPYSLKAAATRLDGTAAKAEVRGTVAPGATETASLQIDATKRGYYDLAVTLSDGGNTALLTRQTSFALLPPDTRRRRGESPFGTWDFTGAHFTSRDADEVGPLYLKAGLRYGMFGFTAEEREKYGVLPGNEPRIVGWGGARLGAAEYRKVLEKNPDMIPSALIFHEASISGDHIKRVPDLFVDRAPYQLNEAEKARFQEMWDQAVAGAQSMRKEFPDVKLSLGNGTLPVKEEFYRHKFPAELFDYGGNETGSFGRPPEAQPPDCIAFNASLWMDRQLLDAYGYPDKPVYQCYEVCYPNTNPGNLDVRTQADYFIRHSLHALAWGIPRIRIGLISDVGTSYYFSNWGASGFCNRYPELNAKPAYVAMATMTWVLDGAKFKRVVDMGSPSLYGLEFDRPDGSHALAMWTIRGRRPVRLAFSGAGEFTLIDGQAEQSSGKAQDGAVELTLTPSPVYLVTAAAVTSVAPGAPRYEDKPAGVSAVLSDLSSLDGWTLETRHNYQLEYYDFMTPRRLGDFAFEPVAAFEGKEKALKVAPRPIPTGKDTMPMYAVLAHKTGIPVPGTPTEIGVWVNGNSSWGRVIFELQDASGQRWMSIGAAQKGSAGVWFNESIPEELRGASAAEELRDKEKGAPQADWNTDDLFGASRIDFDGWRYLAFPLPGQYPGEGYHWPRNSQWFSDKDGVVHYPLTFKKLIVELPEKTLHVKTFAPAPRPEIYLKDLTVGQGDTTMLKTTIGER